MIIKPVFLTSKNHLSCFSLKEKHLGTLKNCLTCFPSGSDKVWTPPPYGPPYGPLLWTPLWTPSVSLYSRSFHGVSLFGESADRDKFRFTSSSTSFLIEAKFEGIVSPWGCGGHLVSGAKSHIKGMGQWTFLFNLR